MTIEVRSSVGNESNAAELERVSVGGSPCQCACLSNILYSETDRSQPTQIRQPPCSLMAVNALEVELETWSQMLFE